MISGTDKIFNAIQTGISPLKTALQNAKTGKSPDLSSALQSDQFSFSSAGVRALEFLNSLGKSDDGDDSLGDLGKMEQLKQRGEMLANALQMKLKSFETRLVQQMQSAGIDTSQEMRLEDGGIMGILETGGHPDMDRINQLFQNNPDMIQNFREISQLADLIRNLQQIPDDVTAGSMNLANIAAMYARESQQNQDFDMNAQFVMKVLPSGASFTFE